MKVRNNYVVVKKTMTEKKSKIILLPPAKEEDKFDYAFSIYQKGPKCGNDFEVGDIPIFTEYVRFQGVKVIEKEDTKIVILTIVHEDDIIAIEKMNNNESKVI